MRFPLEIFDTCREVWPSQEPMSVRISASDWMPGGLPEDEAVEAARFRTGARDERPFFVFLVRG